MNVAEALVDVIRFAKEEFWWQIIIEAAMPVTVQANGDLIACCMLFPSHISS